jgi:hypothetical protein
VCRCAHSWTTQRKVAFLLVTRHSGRTAPKIRPSGADASPSLFGGVRRALLLHFAAVPLFERIRNGVRAAGCPQVKRTLERGSTQLSNPISTRGVGAIGGSCIILVEAVLALGTHNRMLGVPTNARSCMPMSWTFASMWISRTLNLRYCHRISAARGPCLRHVPYLTPVCDGSRLPRQPSRPAPRLRWRADSLVGLAVTGVGIIPAFVTSRGVF